MPNVLIGSRDWVNAVVAEIQAIVDKEPLTAPEHEHDWQYSPALDNFGCFCGAERSLIG